jgi:hypothetical protein
LLDAFLLCPFSGQQHLCRPTLFLFLTTIAIAKFVDLVNGDHKQLYVGMLRVRTTTSLSNLLLHTSPPQVVQVIN